MTERWRKELETLDLLEAPSDVVENARSRPAHPDRGRGSRIVTGLVAFAVFALAGAFVWRAFDSEVPPADVGTAAGLPILRVRMTDAGVPDANDDLRQVDTLIEYGDARLEGSTSTIPEGEIVEWVAAEDLTRFVPGPTIDSLVEVDADGGDPRALIGPADAWPDFGRFERIERLPSTPGDYVLLFEADYPEGVAREALRMHIVEPGILQLSLVEGGALGAATAVAYVDGTGVDGFLSSSSFMQSDVGVSSAPQEPTFDAEASLSIPQGAPILLVTQVDEAEAGVYASYERTPGDLPLDLTQNEALPVPPGDYLLAVEAKWAHGQVGWANNGTRETARFFFPIKVIGESSEPSPSTQPPVLDPIVVTSPSRGAEVTAPVLVSGTAEVSEGTVTIWIMDGTNNRIAMATAVSCGAGCRGDFAVEVPYSVGGPQAGEIVVFEESAADGERLNTVRIPVTLSPGPQDPVTAEVEGPWFAESGLELPDGSDGEPLVMAVHEGPDHCGMTSLSIASLAWPMGSAYDDPDEPGTSYRRYIRDPEGLGWAASPTAPFESGEQLPDDAYFTGYQRGEWQLWIAPSDEDEAIYMVRGDAAAGGIWERWPRGRIGCV